MQKATPGDLAALFAEISSLSSVDFRNDVLAMLWAHWADVDAPAGFAFVQSLPAGTVKSRALEKLLASWAQLDQQAAYQAISTLADKTRIKVMDSVGNELLRISPAAFLEWFRMAKQPLPGWNSRAWLKLAKEHAEEIKAIAAEIYAAEIADKTKSTSPAPSSRLYRILALAMAEVDAQASLAWAKEAPELVRKEAVAAALESIVMQDPKSVTQHLDLVKAKQVGANFFLGGSDAFLLGKAVETLAKKDPLDALKWLNGEKDELGDKKSDGYSALSKSLGKAVQDGSLPFESAFEALRKVDKNLKTNVLWNMFEEMTPSKLAETAEWLKHSNSKETRSQALERLIFSWNKQDKPAAEAFLAGLGDPKMASQIQKNLQQQASPFNTTPETIRSLPPAQQAVAIIKKFPRMDEGGLGMFSGFGEARDPESYAELLGSLPESKQRLAAVKAVAGSWAARDPISALEWAQAPANAAIGREFTGPVIAGWAKQDAWGASQWAQEQPSGPVKDSASQELARHLSQDEPDSAWQWASAVQDEATRLAAQSEVLKDWGKAHPAEAQAAVDGILGNLPESAQQQLLQALQGGTKITP